MSPTRILWQILPRGGVFGWKILQDGVFLRSFLTQAGAIREARRLSKFEWDTARVTSEIQIHNAEGQIRDKDTWPRESDPAGNG